MSSGEVYATLAGLRAGLRSSRAGGLPVGGLGRLLWDVVRGLPSTLGDYVRRASLGVSPGRGRSLLPLPVAAFVEHGVRRCPGSPLSQAEIVAWFSLVGHSLNFLGTGCGGGAGAALPPERPSPAQERALERLAEVLWWFLSEDDERPASIDEIMRDARSKRFGYHGEVVSCRRTLVPSKVFPTWPNKGQVAVLSLERWLPPSLRDQIVDPWKCLKPRSEWPERPHPSRVHASQEDWDEIAREGLARGIFREIREDELFLGRQGLPILSGAMGVDKYKEEGGVVRHYLRFISIMTPLNQHMREIRGDVDFLPYIAHAMLIVLGEDEEAVVDSEDFVSCFNLVQMPRSWDGFLAYEKRVSGSVFGRGPSEAGRIGLTTVPMGWSGAVAVVQAVVRQLVFGLAEVNVDTEIAKCKAFPTGPDYSLIYLDSFDFIRVRGARTLAYLEGSDSTDSEEHQRFLQVCHTLGLPLNEGKALVRSYTATLQGGEFDGQRGLLSHARKRGRHLVRLSLGLAAEASWDEVVLRHWAGLACFAASYRRPLFSVLGYLFEYVDRMQGAGEPEKGVLDEVLLFAALLPVAVTNLRAAVVPRVSCSDASPWGGGAAVAESFGDVFGDPPRETDASTPGSFPCPGGCGRCLASLGALLHHRGAPEECSGVPRGGVLCFLFVGRTAWFEGVAGAVARLGVEVDSFGWAAPKLVREAFWSPEKFWVYLRPESLRAGRGFERQPVRGSKGHAVAAEDGDAADATGDPLEQWRLSLQALEARAHRDGIVVVELPLGSPGLQWPRLRGLARGHRVFVMELMDVTLLTSSQKLFHDWANHVGHESDFTEASRSSWLAWMAAYAARVEKEIRLGLVPRGPGERDTWLQAQLADASARLGEQVCNRAMAAELRRWLAGMSRGRETEHLRAVMRMADHRGSDVQLWSGELLRRTRQSAPYPAFRWAWRATASYPWTQEGHINVLELAAFLNHVRQEAMNNRLQSTRFLHVLDSTVACAVIAKGRSSARLLNRPMRQLAGVLLATDAYPFVVWTISGWNFADRASRAVPPAVVRRRDG